jgi:phage terminase large subunit
MELEIIPRPQFRPYLLRHQRWAVLVCHRRAGKTFAVIQDLIAKALTYERIGPPLRYAYVAPTRVQAKDISWSYIKQFVSGIAGVEVSESNLRVTFPNKASITLYSGENYERMRGLYFDGVVLDEYADIPPAAWSQVIRPCLSDYQGWATFIGTPKGRNAFYKLHRAAMNDPNWFSLHLKASESGIIPAHELEEIRKSIPNFDYQQEFEASFDVGRPGAVYAEAITTARLEGRIINFRPDHSTVVHTTWDLGAPHNTVIIYWQKVGLTYRILDCDFGMNVNTAERVAHMFNKGYNFGTHFLPHDSKKVEYDAMSFAQKLRACGLQNIRKIERVGHNAEEKRVQTMMDLFENIYFNASKCEVEGGLIEALTEYHRKVQTEGGGEWVSNVLVHDWSSHFADAFGYWGEALKRNLVPAAGRTVERIQESADMPVHGKLSDASGNPLARRAKQTEASR